MDEQTFSCSFKYLEQQLYSPHQSPLRLHPVRATPGILFISAVNKNTQAIHVYVVAWSSVFESGFCELLSLTRNSFLLLGYPSRIAFIMSEAWEKQSTWKFKILEATTFIFEWCLFSTSPLFLSPFPSPARNTSTDRRNRILQFFASCWNLYLIFTNLNI